ncbi:uncharacterized protein TNCV_1669431 [Trichonephila clavipes]|nr:uncharacterized protein TNCV_1669431 [Trichonephila clavipes]
MLKKKACPLNFFVLFYVVSLSICISCTQSDTLETDISHIFVSDSLKGKNKDIPEFKESVLKLEAETQCSKDIDCHYAGKCITTAEGSKECECKNGTSGSLCQDVDDCVANPYMCGNGTDVRCIFDVSVEKATCKCDNFRKKFDPGTETCRIPCKYGDCGRYGSCHTDFFLNDPVKFCWCREGVRGDRCEIIDVCVNKDVDCGDDPTASCELDLNAKAYCKCSEKDQIFDYDAKICRERTERAIVIWIEEQVQRRIPESGYLIQEKALQFYKSMKQSEPSTSTSQAGKEFSASKGWLTSHDDIEELLVDDALSDNDIIDLTLDLTVDGVVGLEGDDEEEKSTPLTGKLIQGLQLCSKLENHFLINDPNSERASKLKRELQNCMSGYRELYKKIKEFSSQSLITDYIVRKGRATQNENEVCEDLWPLPQISIAETVSSDDKGDLEPLRKRCKPLSDSDNE